ncbi:MAG: hypothetical protein K0Q50_1615 [Vampirovibrio sp.]|jgi:hypothetical protein|nr:hypothetical protein [Vampirovibrio sp.]
MTSIFTSSLLEPTKPYSSPNSPRLNQQPNLLSIPASFPELDADCFEPGSEAPSPIRQAFTKGDNITLTEAPKFSFANPFEEMESSHPPEPVFDDPFKAYYDSLLADTDDDSDTEEKLPSKSDRSAGPPETYKLTKDEHGRLTPASRKTLLTYLSHPQHLDLLPSDLCNSVFDNSIDRSLINTYQKLLRDTGLQSIPRVEKSKKRSLTETEEQALVVKNDEKLHKLLKKKKLV